MVDAANAEAWRLFHRVVNRFTGDGHLVALALETLRGEVAHQSFADLLERFRILYDALNPPPEPTKGD